MVDCKHKLERLETIKIPRFQCLKCSMLFYQKRGKRSANKKLAAHAFVDPEYGMLHAYSCAFTQVREVGVWPNGQPRRERIRVCDKPARRLHYNDKTFCENHFNPREDEEMTRYKEATERLNVRAREHMKEFDELTAQLRFEEGMSTTTRPPLPETEGLGGVLML